jgi:hypothetical protein
VTRLISASHENTIRLGKCLPNSTRRLLRRKRAEAPCVDSSPIHFPQSSRFTYHYESRKQTNKQATTQTMHTAHHDTFPHGTHFASHISKYASSTLHHVRLRLFFQLPPPFSSVRHPHTQTKTVFWRGRWRRPSLSRRSRTAEPAHGCTATACADASSSAAATPQ